MREKDTPPNVDTSRIISFSSYNKVPLNKLCRDASIIGRLGRDVLSCAWNGRRTDSTNQESLVEFVSVLTSLMMEEGTFLSLNVLRGSV